MKRALVLGGGGSRGSYELGGVEALHDLNVDFEIVIGTSIGALNAVFISQGDMNLYRELWNNITIDQIMNDGINMYNDIREYKIEDVNKFIKTYRKNGGADISPLIKLVKTSIDESKVRSSPIRMGVVTVKFPSLEPVEIMVDDIPEGLVTDYVLASASLFPAFPAYRIGKSEYIDGGYYDTVAANFALEQGAEELICYDIMPVLSHPQLIGKPFIKYIYPVRSLGSVLMFDRKVLDDNRARGYNDTMRAFGKYFGGEFSFSADGLVGCRRAALKFSLDIACTEAALAPRNVLGKLLHMPTPLSDRLKKQQRAFVSVICENELIAGAEICATLLGLDDTVVYKLRQLKYDILGEIPVPEAEKIFKKLRGTSEMEFNSVLNNATTPMRIAILFASLREEGTCTPRMLGAAESYTDEFISAMFMTSAM